jgi:thiol-disulfide isomerase/thioredoxin
MKKLNPRLALKLPFMTAAILSSSSGMAQSPDRSAQVEALKQGIWSDYSAVMTAQATLPPAKRVSGDALTALQVQERRPVIGNLRSLAAADPHDAAALQALGLVFEWGDQDAANRALQDLIRDHSDDDALSPVLQAAYGNSPAMGKRAQLDALARRTRSRAVKGAALYLLALETLSSTEKGRAIHARDEALSQLRLVRDGYGESPAILLGAGEVPTLGHAAAALIFKTERLRVGAPLPPLSAVDLDGKSVSSAEFRGKTTLIDFWATWCPPCVAALPEVRSLYRAFGPQTLNIVSISADADPNTVKAFMTRNSIPWTQWRVGPSGKLSNEWSNGSYPLYILVGPQGRILSEGQSFSIIAEWLKRQRLEHQTQPTLRNVLSKRAATKSEQHGL